MSAGKKHGLANGDNEHEPAAKKVRTDPGALNGAGVAEGAVKKEKKEKKKDRKEEKDKKGKKDKKEKKDKHKKEKKEKKQPNEKNLKQDEEEKPSEESPRETEPTVVTEVPSSGDSLQSEGSRSEVKKGKKEKEKKEKKEKQGKRTETGQATENGSADSSLGSTIYRYRQTDALSSVLESEVKDFLHTQQVTISDPSSTTTHRPVLKFDQLPASSLLGKSPFAGFTTPTPIQSASWPFSLSGRDVVGIAETGSGKTLAFSVPCVEALHSLLVGERRSAAGKNSNRRSTHALAVIVSPTRELAMQTHATISALAALVGLSSVCLFGGASKDEQRALLQKGKNGTGAEIVVATPGRLKDFLSDGTVSLSSARFVVLDEADRMLDKGFEDDVKLILSLCPEKGHRQTLMFTATWPASVRGLAESFMVDPVKITIGGRTRAGGDGEDGESGNNNDGVVELQANSRISQKVEVVGPWEKENRLAQLLAQAQKGSGKNDRILVFCLYKKEAVRVENNLSRKGIKVASIHGDLRQEQRTRSLEAFKSGTTTVLVATDVAARGLDIPEVKLVINVTFPLTIEDYVHRIGRTGRAGKTGQAITLFTEHDKAHSGSLINILKGANQPVPEELLKFGTTVKKKAHDTYGAFFKDVDMSKKGKKITFD